MSEKMVRVMRERSHRMHDLLLEMGEGLTEEQLRWIPSQTAPPIRWHLWHIGRFADMHHAEFLADADSSASLTSEEMEIWHKENIALEWGLNTSQLGRYEAGVGMDDQIAATLPLPEKAVLLAYCRRAFEAFNQIVDTQPIERYDEIIEGVGYHITHAWRHLGMIEALKGAQNVSGTATI